VRPANLFFDTMIAAFLLDSEGGTYTLDHMAERRLGFRTKPYTDLVGRDQTLQDIPIQQVTDYSGEDADLALRLSGILAEELAAEGLDGVFDDISAVHHFRPSDTPDADNFGDRVDDPLQG
jgi:DNA polymerase-1